jgi:hypothetical protein
MRQEKLLATKGIPEGAKRIRRKKLVEAVASDRRVIMIADGLVSYKRVIDLQLFVRRIVELRDTIYWSRRFKVYKPEDKSHEWRLFVAWNSGKYKTKKDCARAMSGILGISDAYAYNILFRYLVSKKPQTARIADSATTWEES